MIEGSIDGSIGGAEIQPEPQQVHGDGGMVKRPGRPGIGWVLIALGALLLVGNLFHVSGSIFLIALGGAFLAGYFTNRSYGLLIPAMILISLGLGAMFDDWRAFNLHGYVMPLFLGLGFISIYLVDRFSWHQSSLWPLWPGGILVIIALWGIAVETGLFRDIWWEMMDLLGTWWPVLFIIWGVYLLRKRGEKTEQCTKRGQPLR